MKFVHLSDVHLVAGGGELNGCVPSQRLRSCLDDILQWHSDAEFCVISGDLTEFAEPGAYQLLKDMLGAFPLPYFLMMGNHDDRDVFLRIFDNYHQDPLGFIQFKHQCSAGAFIFLDTSKDGTDAHEGQLCRARLEWLKEQLIAAEDEPVFMFIHHPPFDIGVSYVDEIKLMESEKFALVLKYAKNLRHVFFGHVHRMTSVNWKGIPFTSPPSLNHQIPMVPESVDGEFCDEPPAYSVVNVTADQVVVHFNTFLQRNPLHQTLL